MHQRYEKYTAVDKLPSRKKTTKKVVSGTVELTALSRLE
jgi:hypothetical protein